MIHCFVPTKSISILTTRLVEKYSSTIKLLKANLNQKLAPLRFSGSTLRALSWLSCVLVLPKLLMFAAHCHIGSPHHCNLTWQPFFFLINYGEGECYAQLCLSQDSQESSIEDSCSSFLWFIVMSWEHAMHVPLCPSLVLFWKHCLAFYPPYHNFKKLLLKTGYIIPFTKVVYTMLDIALLECM